MRAHAGMELMGTQARRRGTVLLVACMVATLGAPRAHAGEGGASGAAGGWGSSPAEGGASGAAGGWGTAPDQVDPPAPGEGQPLADPSDPPQASYYAQPAPRVTLTGTGFAPQAVEQLAGPNRFATAVATSRTGWPGGAPAVVLATGDDYPDALAGSTLAGTVGGPLLLTPSDRLDADVAAELRRLEPRAVYLVGALTDSVETAVAALGPATERLRGQDRYATAFAVARRAAELGAETATVLVASGEGFADALSASAVAAGLRQPILLTRPGLRDLLVERVAALGARRSLVVGGAAALPDEAVRGLPGLERVAGVERTATAAAVADRARAAGFAGVPVLVGGEAFADGLTGGTFAGAARRAPLLVTGRRELSPSPAEWIQRNGVATLTIVGGPVAVSPVAACQLTAGNTRAFRCVEEELARQGYNTGVPEGLVDHQTVWMTYAFQKVAGLPVTGEFGEREWQVMLLDPRLAVRRPDLGPDHIEIDLARQLILVVRAGQVRHALHTSTGKPSTPTVRGAFTVYEKRNFRQSWNAMYRPVFFYRGYAIHGYPVIPLYPASHGCARTYDGDMDFLWPMLWIGERVATF